MQQSKDKCKRIHHLGKLIKIRIEAKEEKTQTLTKGDFYSIPK